jgi:hydrogenase maturation protein HypF
VAHDLHPDYLSTTYALARDGVEHIAVQHHHAHLAAVLAEHGERGPAIGAIYDGTGYGTDAPCGAASCRPAASTIRARGPSVARALPGGDRAVRQPWRMACAWLVRCRGRARAAAGDRAAHVACGGRARTHRVAAPRSRRSNGAVSMRVAALCGVRTEVAYEGQAAVGELEAISDRSERGEYPLEATDGVLDARRPSPPSRSRWRRAWTHRGWARAFHRSIARASRPGVCRAAGARGLDTVVLAAACGRTACCSSSPSPCCARRGPARARARAPAAQRRRHLVRAGGGGRGAQAPTR